ncbi:MAG: hypothetical protein N2112_04840 [Gemmataceae bacterium]|nr:hypothetical protein [Gemmataceae bacterium]
MNNRHKNLIWLRDLIIDLSVTRDRLESADDEFSARIATEELHRLLECAETAVRRLEPTPTYQTHYSTRS